MDRNGYMETYRGLCCRYPLAVGRMAIDTAKITVRSGMKGKAVNLIHVYQDHMWTLGDKSDPPNLESLQSADDDESEDEGEEVEALADQTQAELTINEHSSAPEVEHNGHDQQSRLEHDKPELTTKGKTMRNNFCVSVLALPLTATSVLQR